MISAHNKRVKIRSFQIEDLVLGRAYKLENGKSILCLDYGVYTILTNSTHDERRTLKKINPPKGHSL